MGEGKGAIMRCPRCGTTSFWKDDTRRKCKNCEHEFDINDENLGVTKVSYLVWVRFMCQDMLVVTADALVDVFSGDDFTLRCDGDANPPLKAEYKGREDGYHLEGVTLKPGIWFVETNGKHVLIQRIYRLGYAAPEIRFNAREVES